MRGLCPIPVTLAALLALCAATADAQRRRVVVISTSAGGVSSSRILSPSVAGSGSSALVTNPIVELNGVPVSLDGAFTGGISSVPAAGFDFTHHAAVNRNAGVRALIDPVTQHRLALARQIRRETPALAVPVAFPLLVNNIQVNVAPPPVVIVQPEGNTGSDAISQRVERLEYASLRHAVPSATDLQPPPVEAGPAPPQPDPPQLPEFVLLRRDGGLIFAVAFSAVRERLVYITADGFRRSMSLSDLDFEATLQMNEQRGTSLRLPPEPR